MIDRLTSAGLPRACRYLGAIALLAMPAGVFAQGYTVYHNRDAFLQAAAQTTERVESDDFSDYEEGEVDLSDALHPAYVLDHTRLLILDGIDPSIPNPSSPARDTRLFIDDTTTTSAYSNGIQFQGYEGGAGAGRYILRPVEITQTGLPLASGGSINSGLVRMRMVSGRVYGVGVELTGVTRTNTSKLIIRFWDSGFDLYLDIPPASNGEVFIGVLTDQPFDAAQLWLGSVEHGESVGVASITTAFTDPPVELGCPGDTNWDESVNLSDLNAILANFGNDSGLLGVEGGDVNGDHQIDLADLNLLLIHFGYTGCGSDGGGGGGGDGGDGGDDGGGDGGDGGGDGGDGGDGGGDDGGGGDGGDGGGGGDDGGGDGPPPSHGG